MPGLHALAAIALDPHSMYLHALQCDYRWRLRNMTCFVCVPTQTPPASSLHLHSLHGTTVVLLAQFTCAVIDAGGAYPDRGAARPAGNGRAAWTKWPSRRAAPTPLTSPFAQIDEVRA